MRGQELLDKIADTVLAYRYKRKPKKTKGKRRRKKKAP